MCIPDNYIGIRGECVGVEPASGLYINDLPGISLNRAAGATDENYLRGVDFLRANEKLAFELVKQDFKAGMARDFSMRTIIDTFERKVSFGTGQYLALTSTNRYIQVRDILIDQLTKLRINRIDLYARNNYPGFTFNIIDGATTTTYNFDLTTGLNSLPLSYVVQSGTAYIEYDASQVELWEPSHNGIYNRCSEGCINDCSYDLYIDVKYYTGANLTALQPVISRNGIAVYATLFCDLDSVFCQLVDTFKFAIWYRMGILIAEKYLSSDRSNPAVFAAKQDAQRLLTQWKGGVDTDGFEVKSEYWKHFVSAYNQVKEYLKRTDSACFICDSTSTIHLIP